MLLRGVILGVFYARTSAQTSFSLADDEFACAVEDEDTESNFGVHFMLYGWVFWREEVGWNMTLIGKWGGKCLGSKG